MRRLSHILALSFLSSGTFFAGAAPVFAAPLAAPVAAQVKASKVEAITHDPLATQKWKVGEGAPRTTIVYLHGLGSSPTDSLSQRLLEGLSERGESAEVIAPWMRPMKRGADGDIQTAGLQTMSDQLERARVTIAAQPGKMILVGHSFGGKAALQLAKEFPDKVQAVVGLAPSVNMLYSHWKLVTGERGLPDAQTIQQGLDTYEKEMHARLSYASEGEARAIKSDIRYNLVMKDLIKYEPSLERNVKTPTLVLHGTDDQAVSIHYARRFQEANPQVRLIEFEGLGHGLDRFGDDEVTREATQKIAGHVVEWIEQHRERAP